MRMSKKPKPNQVEFLESVCGNSGTGFVEYSIDEVIALL
jgi:hypothetical protein